MFKNILTWLKGPAKDQDAHKAAWSLPSLKAASQLPPTEPVKPPKGGGASYPGYVKTLAKSTAMLPKQGFDVANVDLTATSRQGADSQAILRNLSRVSPELSSAVAANIRVGIP